MTDEIRLFVLVVCCVVTFYACLRLWDYYRAAKNGR